MPLIHKFIPRESMLSSILYWIQGVDSDRLQMEQTYDRLEKKIRLAQKSIKTPVLSADSYPLTNCRNCGANSYAEKCSYCGTVK